MARNDGAFFRLIIILIITFLWLGISFVLMTRGYQEFGGVWLAGLFSFAVVVVLFYLIYEVYRARRGGKAVALLMAWYLFFVIPSIAGHFTALYAFFMGNELIRAEVQEKYEALKVLKGDARLAFLATQGDPQRLSNLLSDLKSEILSYALPGCSTRCRNIVADINAERKSHMTKYIEIPILPTAGRDKNLVYEDYYQRIIGTEQLDLLKQIENETKDPSPPANALIYPSTQGLNTIRDLIEKYGNHAFAVQRLAPDTFKGPTRLSVENAELEKISQAFRSAFKHRDNWSTWTLALAALLINLIAPVFIIGFIGTDSGRAFSFFRRRGGAENLS